jgi:Flp pilus assembly protein TadG
MQKFSLIVVGRDERGTSALEFALVAPVFILLLMGTIFVCIQLFLVGSLKYAVEEGARCASVKTTICADSGSTVTYAQNHYFGPSASPTFTYAAASCGNSVSASLNYVVNLGMMELTLPVTASACYP